MSLCVSRIFPDRPIRFPEDGTEGLLELQADGAVNRLGTLSRQFVQFPIALVGAHDVGRVLLSAESESVTVEEDIDVFREAFDYLIDLGQ